MKDLDFDELDKAVNSLMGANDGKKSDEPAVESSTPESAPAETLATPAPEAASTPAAEPTVPAPEEPQASTPAPKPTPVVKRRGQFMDVVHPSSDMRTANKTTPAAARVGVTIAPSAAMATQPTPTPETPVATPETTPEVPAVSTDMPDPIDMHESMMAKEAAPVEPTEPAEPIEPVPEEMMETVPPAPVSAEVTPMTGSPFLSDAQVEKRPLGSAAPTGDMPAIEATSETKTDEAPVETQQAEGTSVPADVEPVSVPTPEAPATPDPIVTTVEPAPERPTPPSAISQQYKEQESTGDKDHAAIYDTAAVNVPLIHPAKERSGWLWVIWILLLIVVGALGAATLWYFKII